jgi:uncharacterized protein YndB with AHSA1/START domain
MNATSLCVKRVLRADVHRVFAAWSRAEVMSGWFVCDPGWTAKATNELRIGGKYRVVMSSGERTVGIAFGEYLEIEPPHRLVFTWSSEGGVGVEKSIVTIELKELGESTELTLTHDLRPDSEEGRAHARGWEGSLTNLDLYLRRER